MAHLQALGVPESVDLAVWQNFEQMARAKVNWSSATCATLARQLRQTVEAGADGNALLEWVTVRSLLDLPDAWQRMQADAVRQAKQSEGNANAMPTDDANETVEGTVSEGIIETVAEPLSEPLADAEPEPKHNLKQPRKGKTKKEKREAKKPDDVSDETWADFVEHRKARKSLITDRVVEMFRKQAQKANKTLEEAMQIAVMRGWIGFEAEWLEKNKRMQQAGNVAANVMPNASGRLPGESVSDAALRLFLERREKRLRGELAEPLKIGIFNTSSTPALPTPVNGEIIT